MLPVHCQSVAMGHIGPCMTSHHPLKGIGLVLLAVVVFAAMDSSGKYLMTKYNVPLIAALRYAINLVVLSALVMPRHGTALWQTQRTPLVILRAISLATATLFMGLALQRMPLGETVALIYLQGFGVMIAASVFLRERVSWVGWIAAAAGFAGVLLIARPGSSLSTLGVLFALMTAAVSVVYILLSRVLVKTENTTTLLFHVALWGMIIFATLLLLDLRWLELDALDMALVAFLGVGSLTGHYFLTSAYRFAPASLLAPFNYFHIAIALILGWLIYNHVPDAISFIGIAMIAISGAAVAIHSHFNRPAEH
jgi:drug/metabolite transporter (DMT)-like permease